MIDDSNVSKITNTLGKNIFAFSDFAKHFISNSHARKIKEKNYGTKREAERKG